MNRFGFISPGFRSKAPAALLWILVLGLVASTGSTAHAQNDDGGPMVITKTHEFETFHLTELNTSLEALYLYRENTSDTSGEKTTNSEDLYRQIFELDANAYIFDPNFIDLDLLGGFELQERYLDTDTSSQEDVTLINEYDLRGTYRRKSQMPISVYTSRNQSLVDRQFAGSIDSITSTYGATMGLDFGAMTNNLSVSHRELEQSDLTGFSDFSLTQDLFNWQGQYTIAPQNRLDFKYQFEDVQEGGPNRAPRAYQRHTANTNHNVRFGEEDRNNLRSNVYMYKQSGDIETDQLRLSETLDLKHSRTLDSRYDYQFSRQKQASATQTQHRSNAFVRHRLFESLVTTASAGGSVLDHTDGFTSNEVFGNLAFDYNKRVPLGNLTSQLNLGTNIQENGARGVPVQVLGEIHTFEDPNPILLTRRNIIAGSVVVRSTILPMTFTQNLDYTLQEFGDRIEIRRILGGNINNNQAVSIDYLVGPEPANTTTSNTLSFNVRYGINEGAFAGLGVFARYQETNQDIDAEQPDTFVLNSFSDLTLGADYRLGAIHLEGEYQMHDSTILPFNAYRLDARYSRRFSVNGSFQLNVNYTETDYTETDNLTTLLQTSGQIRYKLGPRMAANLALAWRQQENTLNGNSDAFDQEIELNWAHRQTQAYISFRNTFLTADVTENTSQFIEIGLRREF